MMVKNVLLMLLTIAIFCLSVAPVFAYPPRHAFDEALICQHWDNPFKERVLQGVDKEYIQYCND